MPRKASRIIAALGLCLVIVCATLLMTGCTSTNPYLEQLNIDITLNGDGSARIVEKHVVNFSMRDANWWNYYKFIGLNDGGKGNYGETVSEFSDFTCTVDGENYSYDFTALDLDTASHFDKISAIGKSYSNYRSGGIEIGVVMPAFSAGKRTITFAYTLTNLMTGYADCAGLYYKFVDESNTMDIELLTATVKFSAVPSDAVALWTHIEDGGGEGVFKTSGDYVVAAEYRAEDFKAETYFETRLLLPADAYDLDKRNDTTMAKIIAEETAWQTAFLKKARFAYACRIIDYILAGCVLGGGIALTVLFYKKRKPVSGPDAPIYLREIPSGWTAGEMAPLYHYYGKFDVGNSMAATILDLCRRHYIDIDAGEKKKEAEIKLNGLDEKELRPHERAVMDMLRYVGGGKSFTMKDMERKAKRETALFYTKIDEYKTAAKGLTNGMGCYPTKSDKALNTAGMISAGLVVAAVVCGLATFILGGSGVFLICTAAACALSAGIMTLVLRKQKIPLTPKGQSHYDKFRALGKFMQEFSNMDRHEIPQLILWEEYMVYATAMGIADKVSEQLEIAYPEYQDLMKNPRRDRTYMILYLVSPRFRFFNNVLLSSAINGIAREALAIHRAQKIATNVHKFSSGGGGGGFHGGGGFSGGGGGFGGGGMGAR